MLRGMTLIGDDEDDEAGETTEVDVVDVEIDEVGDDRSSPS